MPYQDLREFMACLEQRNALCRVTREVDWDLEIGTIVSILQREGGPAVLFERVKDSPYPLLCNAMGTLEMYAAGLQMPADPRSLQARMMEALQRPIPPVVVDQGPCQDQVIPREAIDLETFPTPRWHPLDGGRYIGTLGIVITRDPDSGVQNAAIYREQIVDRDKTGVLLGRDGGVMLQKYRALGQPMPIATCFGVDPAVLAAAPMAFQYGDDELAMAGALRGEPVPVVRGRTVDLLVPATSEFVFEGYIPPDPAEWLEEGPFGEFTGYYGGERGRQPTIHLTAITHRNDPIMQATQEDRPPNESDYLVTVGRAMSLKQSLIKMGVPGIKDVWSRGLGMIAIISLERHFYSGHARQVIDAALATTRFKYFVVVDADVDVFDAEDVDWALAMHVQPHRDIVITDATRRGSNLDPSIPPEIRPYPMNRTSKMGIDATTHYKGFEWSAPIRPDPEVLARVLERWDEYGLGDVALGAVAGDAAAAQRR